MSSGNRLEKHRLRADEIHSEKAFIDETVWDGGDERFLAALPLAAKTDTIREAQTRGTTYCLAW